MQGGSLRETQGPTTIFCDNQGAVSLAHQDGHHPRRLRHVEIRHYFVRDYVQNGEVNVSFTPTKAAA